MCKQQNTVESLRQLICHLSMNSFEFMINSLLSYYIYLCSAIISVVTVMCKQQSTAESFRHFIGHPSTFRCFNYCLLSHIYFSCFTLAVHEQVMVMNPSRSKMNSLLMNSLSCCCTYWCFTIYTCIYVYFATIMYPQSGE